MPLQTEQLYYYQQKIYYTLQFGVKSKEYSSTAFKAERQDKYYIRYCYCSGGKLKRKKQQQNFYWHVGFGGLEKDDVVLLQRHIKKDSVLITDGNRTYRNLHDIKLKSLRFGKPQIKDNKIIHMNTINSFYSHLKKFTIRFNGVAAKYLDYYVEYFKNIKDNIDIFTALLNNACYCRNVDIRNKRVCFERMVNC